MDFHQLWTIFSTPDNVPIVLLLFVGPFYTWYAFRQAFANDRLIGQLEAGTALPQTAGGSTSLSPPGRGQRRVTARSSHTSPVGPKRCTSGPTCCESSF